MSESAFSYSQDQLKQLARDVLKYAREQGGTDAAVEISEGSGLSVSVRKSKIETIEQNRDKGIGVTVFIGQKRGNASTSDFLVGFAEGDRGSGLQHRPFHGGRRLRRPGGRRTAGKEPARPETVLSMGHLHRGGRGPGAARRGGGFRGRSARDQ